MAGFAHIYRTLPSNERQESSTEWALTVEEQVALMKILAVAPAEPSDRAQTTAMRADALFGSFELSSSR